MYRYLLIALCCLPFTSIAQRDTVYFDREYKKTTKEDAIRYRVFYQLDNKKLRGDNYDSTGTLTGTTEYAKDGKTIDGMDRSYGKNGQLLYEGYYRNGKQDGLTRVWYENGQLYHSVSYKNGNLHGGELSYYENGKVKRKAEYKKGKIQNAEMFDTNGKSIPYTPFEIMPTPPPNLNSYLSTAIHYPASAVIANLEGRVEVQFVVDESGEVTNLKVVNSVNKDLDAEALRVISGMPKWSPGYQDDRPVKVYFTIPILFRLRN